ncbi:hypothetical protein EDEG_01086 [Edhazardia aedis USNM 41457]|uniref:Histidine acid phosphatase n=1 Tax=Edhazardia aedis (strain USNM 41457) TaxID=1003232 RepID=J8ZYI5_EDHAE|nr:hypothetical protein EDEG_01086 [Edhazardia aedis USNM 41457]|eukprot:EJW04723.1 hypothetical protein EDEG_01086 [Edhazardia aedis USNM 41457]
MQIFLPTIFNFLAIQTKSKQDLLINASSLEKSKDNKLDKPATKIIDNNLFEKYKNYCQSTYAIPKQKNDKLKLEKVIIVHRHGDRSPLLKENSLWQSENCISCDLDKNTIKNCSTKKCGDGDLTSKGYEQMVHLGEFIAQNYGYMDISSPKLRCTTIGRTQASLHGVIKGLSNKKIAENVEIPNSDDDSLLIPKDCTYLNMLISSPVSDYFKTTVLNDPFYQKNDKILPQKLADMYLCHLCNKIPVNCGKHNCEKNIIENYIESAFFSWSDQVKKVTSTDKILELVFGRFASDLKNYLTDKDKMRIISVHDTSLATILEGMATLVTEHPPYASAIFIELWVDSSQSKDSVNLEKTKNTLLPSQSLEQSNAQNVTSHIKTQEDNLLKLDGFATSGLKDLDSKNIQNKMLLLNQKNQHNRSNLEKNIENKKYINSSKWLDSISNQSPIKSNSSDEEKSKNHLASDINTEKYIDSKQNFEISQQEHTFKSDEISAKMNHSELFENSYIRIIYNDQVCKTTIDKEENIPMSKLLDYLDILMKNKNEFKKKCMIKRNTTHEDNTLHSKS